MDLMRAHRYAGRTSQTQPNSHPTSKMKGKATITISQNVANRSFAALTVGADRKLSHL